MIVWKKRKIWLQMKLDLMFQQNRGKDFGLKIAC